MEDDAPWRVRGVRGATTVDRNEPAAILAATRELLEEMVARNSIAGDDIASAWFSTTRDLDAEFPAVAARKSLGWHHVALMCSHEMNIPGALPSCLRVLLHVNSQRNQNEIQHVYLRGATVLRPDVVEAERRGTGQPSTDRSGPKNA
jgi:chorismate mutase